MPVVYTADEPELSLHILWQEKLLRVFGDARWTDADHCRNALPRYCWEIYG